ncbi:MAG: TIGR03905 family TSCPD domain-containing protein [Oscillospiraceae bacterium]|nr:TIGR03905 family TSCPD domain-containing protein [Oscillospiraceae bacterium]
MQYTYKTRGTCASKINIETDGDIVRSVEFEGGCNGNLAGISKLVAGLPISLVIDRLSGIRCGLKPTSCPDQLSKALSELSQSPEA